MLAWIDVARASRAPRALGASQTDVGADALVRPVERSSTRVYVRKRKTAELRFAGQPRAAVPAWLLMVLHERDARVHILLWQLGVLGSGFFQDGNIRVSIFPQRQEILVGSAGAGIVAGEGAGASQLQMGEGRNPAPSCTPRDDPESAEIPPQLPAPDALSNMPAHEHKSAVTRLGQPNS